MALFGNKAGGAVANVAQQQAQPASGGQAQGQTQLPQGGQGLNMQGMPMPAAQALTPEQEHAMLASMAFSSKAFKDANPTDRNPFHKAGRYLLKLEEIKLSRSNSPNKQGAIGVGVTSTILYVFDDGSHQTKVISLQPAGPGHVAGTKVFQSYDMGNVASVSAFKGMLAKILDLPPAEVPEQAAFSVTHPSQPLAGTCVVVDNRWDKTAGKGRSGKPEDFLYVNYEAGTIPRTEIKAGVAAGQLNKDVVERAFPQGLLERLVQNELAEAEALKQAQQGQQAPGQ